MVFFGGCLVSRWLVLCAGKAVGRVEGRRPGLGLALVSCALVLACARASRAQVGVQAAIAGVDEGSWRVPALSGLVVEAEGASGRSRRNWRDVVPVYDHPVRPFSEFGAAVKLSTLGPGFELVTPLLRNWNLRGSANFFDFGLAVTNEGVTYHGELHMRSGGLNLDWFPRHGGFHLGPGVMIFNPRIGGGITIPGGMQYTLNGQTFTSSETDPIHGDARLAFSRRVAPSMTIGFANVIPRSGKRWTVPIELGVAYIGPSTVSIVLAGTACQPSGCEDVSTDADSQADLQQQVREINEDLKRAQFFPIVSIGVGYRF